MYDHEQLRYRTGTYWKDWVLLALSHVSGRMLVLMGSAVLEPVEVAARALHSGATGRILVSGGIGHSTPHLYEAIARHPTYPRDRCGRAAGTSSATSCGTT
jgi:hypothetical protein